MSLKPKVALAQDLLQMLVEFLPQVAERVDAVARGETDNDILALIHLIRTTVHEQTGFWMDAEVRHISPSGDVRPAHISAGERALVSAA